MSKDMISSSEDEATQRELPAKRRKEDGYQCPSDFVSFSHKPCSSTLMGSLKDGKTELWLIKAPGNFSPDRFNSLKTPLSGLQTMKAPGQSGCGQIYSVLGSPSGASELRLLTSHAHKPSKVVFGPAFSGLLNVCESHGDVSTNLAPQAIPAAPAPCIPPGLRQRFQPFGSKTPTLSRVEPDTPPPPVPSGSAYTLFCLPAGRMMVKQEPEEESGRKKKRKRERRSVAMEGGEEEAGEEERVRVRVKMEPADPTPNQQGSPQALEETDLMEERRKRKKKKRDKEREKEVWKGPP